MESGAAGGGGGGREGNHYVLHDTRLDKWCNTRLDKLYASSSGTPTAYMWSRKTTLVLEH